MTKVVSLTVAHYGADFLEWGLRSIRDSVDEMWCLYTPVGSFGHHANIPCPETREQLYALACAGAGNKLRWYENTYAGEGIHRDSIYQLAPDADVVIVLDTDEVYQEGLVEEIVKHLESHDDKSLRVPVSHAWRSFHKWILNDGMHGEHAHAPKHTGQYRAPFETDKRIFHYGYAQNLRIMRYKIETHGHKPEFRQGWFEDKVIPNAQEDVHPVVIGAWNPTDVDPFSIGLPAWMKDHPFANLEVIE